MGRIGKVHEDMKEIRFECHVPLTFPICSAPMKQPISQPKQECVRCGNRPACRNWFLLSFNNSKLISSLLSCLYLCFRPPPDNRGVTLGLWSMINIRRCENLIESRMNFFLWKPFVESFGSATWWPNLLLLQWWQCVRQILDSWMKSYLKAFGIIWTV